MRKAVPVFLCLAGVSLIVVMYLAPSYFQGSASSLTVVGGSSGSTGAAGAVQQSRRVAQLEKEVERLKEVLAREQAASADPKRASVSLAIPDPSMENRDSFSVNIDLLEFLGKQHFFAGIGWDPIGCMAGWKAMFPNITNEEVFAGRDKMVLELRAKLADIKKVKSEDIPTDKVYHEIFGKGPDDVAMLASDPDIDLWRKEIIPIMTKYMGRGDPGQRIESILVDTCKHVKGKAFKLEQLGTAEADCLPELGTEAIARTLGVWHDPDMPIIDIATGWFEYGTCGLQYRDGMSFGKWLRTKRMFTPDWMTFAVATPEQDAVVLLFDVMYEKMAVFTKQYWLGTINMQNPFDMYSIQDILFTVRPTFMLETGTANGGSALLWASVMHLCGMEDKKMDEAKIATIDVIEPAWEAGKGTWGGVPRADPTQHKLWKKHVTFIKGSTVDETIVKQVKAMAAGQKVMVLLDSHHSEAHVTDEMAVYCPLVSVGSYCIVEDTKMSRWASNGPLESVKKFLASHPEFEMDRDRELLYSHHAMGYLKRIS
ncbi:hypothetical protein FOA52_005644 [Chlamydomonas sp. UWO 241]|nr:hypothetical protein FOA52_005644 [Chlamydomonas sp. UWO 241]